VLQRFLGNKRQEWTHMSVNVSGVTIPEEQWEFGAETLAKQSYIDEICHELKDISEDI
jgi:cyclopropane fatty-acyl-phospholipid synthase-like methyltransferase